MLLRKFVLFIIVCICKVHGSVKFDIYKPNEFKLSLPDDKKVVNFYVKALHDYNDNLPEESQYIVNKNVIKVAGNQFNLIKGSDINYTIGFTDAAGYHDIQGRYVFNGEYTNKHAARARRGFYETNNNDEQKSEKNTKVTTEETSTNAKDLDTEPIDLSSRFGGGFGKPAHFHYKGPRFGPPPFLPNEFGPRSYYPYHHGRDYELHRWDHGHGPNRWPHHPHKHDGPCSHHSNEFDEEEFDYNSKDYTSKPFTTQSTTEATTEYKPQIDIRISDNNN